MLVASVEKMETKEMYLRGSESHFSGACSGSPVVRTLLPLQGACIQSLVGELGSICLVAKNQNRSNIITNS